MEVEVSTTGNKIHAQIRGAISESDSDLLKETFTKLYESEYNRISIDLKHVPTISSSGIGKLIALFRRLKEQRKEFEINGIHENLFALFNSIHLDKLFTIKR